MPKKLVMCKSALTILLLLTCFTGLGNCSNVKHGIEFKLSPLRLSQQDLISILRKVHNLVSEANKGSYNKSIQERFSISGSGITINEEGEPQFIGSFSSMDVANYVDYYYNNFGSEISSVEITLHSSYRKVSIEGTSQEQIESLAAYIRQSFDQYTVWFGGFVADISVAIAIGLALCIILNLLLKKLERKHGPAPKYYSFIILFFCGLFSLSLEINFMFIDLFPGVAIYKGNASIIVRQLPLITFIGLLVGIAGLVLAFIALRRSKLHKQEPIAQTPSETKDEKDNN